MDEPSGMLSKKPPPVLGVSSHDPESVRVRVGGAGVGSSRIMEEPSGTLSKKPEATETPRGGTRPGPGRGAPERGIAEPRAGAAGMADIDGRGK